MSAGKNRMRRAKPQPEVIDLLDSDSDLEDGLRPARRNTSATAAAAAQQKANRPDNGSAPPPVPRSATSSPVSTVTTTSKNPLAGLLAGSSKPATARAARGTKSSGATATAKAGAAKRKQPGSSNGTEVQRKAATNKAQSTTAATDKSSATEDPQHSAELWSFKHAPRSPDDLIVHKKKVEEVLEWLKMQLAAAGRPGARKMLLVSGPPGCGKTATLRALGTSLGFNIVEWQAQAEASYDEYRYMNARESYQNGSYSEFYDRNSGSGYVSKLAAFEDFAAHAKMPALSLVSNTGQPSSSQSLAKLPPTLVFIDDLPFTSDAEQKTRLGRAVADLARSARFPVVLFSTEASGRSQQDKSDRTAPEGLPKEVAAALQSVGIETISFNPITALNTVKALKKVLEVERRALSDSQITAIAEHADGDLRNAINSLQFACTGAAAIAAPPAVAKRQRGAAGQSGRKKAAETNPADIDSVSFMLRDTSLSLFHGLGKLLYNKRLPRTTANNNDAAAAAWTERGAFDGFDPESVLAASGLEAQSVAAFLHENIPNFVEDSCIEDLSACLEQLSAADCLASNGRRRRTNALAEDDVPGGSTLAEACAANVAARGVCFYNAHPAPRRWLPLKAPSLYVVQRGMNANSAQLHDAAGAGRVLYGNSGGLNSASQLAAEMLPTLRMLCSGSGGAPPPASLVYQQPASWTRYWNGKLYETALHPKVDVQAVAAAAAEGGGAGAAIFEEDPIEDPDD